MEKMINEIAEALKQTKYGSRETTLNDLSIYSNELITWNEKFNLTSITQPKEIAIKHIADSLIPISAGIFKFDGELADCGTGAGIPGILIAIAEPSACITLIESNGKKTSFLKNVCEKLKLKNIAVVQARSEDLARSKQFRHKFDAVTMRAFANFSAALELTSELIKPGGTLYYFASKEQSENITGKEKAVTELKFDNINKFSYSLPENMGNREIVILFKHGNAKETYPRPYSKIKAHPLI